MATISSLRARHEAILVQYAEHDAFVRSVQRTALDELVPALVQEAEQPLDEAQVNLLRDFLHDSGTSWSRERPRPWLLGKLVA